MDPARWGAIAAALGGATWVVKAAGIMLTGNQPPVFFGLGPPLFALGLLALHANIPPEAGKARRAGRLLAWAALGFLGATAVLWLAAPELLPKDERFRPGSLLLAATFVSILAALACLGVAARRTRALGRASWLPLAMSATIVPLIVLFGLTGSLLEGQGHSEAGERLIEPPILLFGSGWIALSLRLWPRRATADGPAGLTLA